MYTNIFIFSGEYLLKLLEKNNFIARFVFSTCQDRDDISKQWTSDVLQVLITTTLGIVGNENTSTQYVGIIGYLYDILSVFQSIGRIRPHRRQKGISMIKVTVPVLNDYIRQSMQRDDEQKFISLKSAKLLKEEDKAIFHQCLSSKSVVDWIHNECQCRRQALLSRLGADKIGEICGDCDVCTSNISHITQMAMKATKKIKQTEVSMHKAKQILRELGNSCSLCRKQSCNGFVCLPNHKKKWYDGRCFKCLSKQHRSKECQIIFQCFKDKSCCYYCFGHHSYLGQTFHLPGTECILQDRLKVTIQLDYLLNNSSQNENGFINHLHKIYATEQTFMNFINEKVHFKSFVNPYEKSSLTVSRTLNTSSVINPYIKSSSYVSSLNSSSVLNPYKKK